ncbi:MAG: hypothetical protein ACJ75S_10885 [Solirubrobacterales bacterium]
MRMEEGRLVRAAPLPIPALGRLVNPLQIGVRGIPSGAGRTLYYSMTHRTQLYLNEGQYRWLKQRAGKAGSIAAVVRDLIDAERARGLDPGADPLLSYLVDEAPGQGREKTSVSTLDRDIYG